MNIQKKIIISVLVVAVIPFIMMIYMHQSFVNEYQEEAVTDFVDAAYLVNDEIDHYLGDQLKAVQQLAIKLKENSQPSYLNQKETYQSLIDELLVFLEWNPELIFVYGFDRELSPIISLTRTQENRVIDTSSSLLKTMDNNQLVFLKETLKSMTGEGDAYGGSPVYDRFVNNQFGTDTLFFPIFISLGNPEQDDSISLLFYVDMNEVVNLLVEGVRALEAMGAYNVRLHLLDRNGRVLANSDNQLFELLQNNKNIIGAERIQEEVQHKLESEPSNQIYGWFLHDVFENPEKNQLINYYMSDHNSHSYPFEWIVVVDQPLDEALDAIGSSYRKIILIGFISIGLVMIIGIWIGKRLSSPIMAIAETLHRYRQGVIDTEITGLDRADEIGELAKAFVMYREQQQQHDQIVDKYIDQYHKLTAAQKEADNLLTMAVDAIVMVNKEGVIVKVNPAANRIFGYEKHELVGKSFELLVPQRYKHHIHKLSQRYLSNPIHRPIAEGSKLYALRKDGSEFSVSISLAPTQTVDGLVVAATIRDISKEIRYQEEMRKLATVAEETTNLVAVCDKNGMIIWVNTSFETVTGYKSDEVLGNSLIDLLSGQQLSSITVKVKEAFAKLMPIRVDMQSASRFGTNIWLDINLQPVSGEHGLEHFVMIATDITYYKLMQKQLVRTNDSLESKVIERTKELSVALEKADEAAKIKAEFLATMSHEIRTPINGVMGMAELLKKTRLDEKQHRMLDTIMSSSNLLRTVIDDILDFTRIEAGKLELKTSDISVVEILRDVGELLGPLAVEKSIKLILAAHPSFPMIQADPVRLRQILFNLVGNAIKFTPASGQVSVFADFRQGKGNTIDVDFIVKDTGVGIDVEKQRKLFQPFSQIDSSTTRRYGGSGLGLSIVSLLVELMEGTISLDSEQDKGSEFGVHVNFIIAEKNDQPAFEHCPHVILINVPADISNRLAEMCSQAGVKSTTNSNWENIADVINSIDMKGADEVVVVALPGMNNIDKTIDQLNKALDCHANYRVLLLTAEKHDIQNPAFTEIMSNPLNLNDVLESILNMHVDAKNSDKKKQHAVEQKDNKDKPKDVRFEILVAEDNLVNQDLFRLQLNMLGHDAVIVNNGVEALECFQKNKFVLVLTDCHMPEMDGFQLTRELRRLEKSTGCRVPIIAVTADVLVDKDKLNPEAGFDEYITKPVSLEKLSGVLNRWLMDGRGISNDESGNEKAI